MSRWDALKPDGRSNASGKQATSSDVSKRRRPQHQHAPATTRWQGRHQPTESSFPRRNLKTTHVDEWDRILERLQQQLEKEEKRNELSSSILQNLQQLSEMFDTKTSATSRGKAVAILVEFLPNQEQSIQQSILGLLNHLLENPGVEFGTQEQANKAIAVLSSECQSSGNPVAVQCFTRLIQASIKYLPAEETAHGVVAQVLLPRIEASTYDSLAIVISILKVLNALVADSRQASALLAPLVQDVGLDGKEEQVFNPLRQRLFSTLQRRLLVGEEVLIRQEACRCLAQTLVAAHRLDGDHHSSSIKRDVDMGGMERFLIEILSRPSNEKNTVEEVQPLLLPALDLLRVLIKRHPDASAGIGTKLLVAPKRQTGGARETEACTVCSKHPFAFVPFIERVHSCSYDVAVVAISTFCLADLLETMPLQKWLVGPKTMTLSITSRKIIDSLEIIIEVTRCRFLRPAIMAIESLSRLAKVILAEIPYENKHLVIVASKLWASLGELVYRPDQSQQVKTTLAEVLVDSMGGRVTPQGYLTPMCIPAQVYLSNSSSTSSLLNQIISSIESNDGCFQQSTEMLRGILRTRPKTAHVDWDRLHMILLRNVESDSKELRLSSLQILEGLVLGRKDFGDDTEDKFTTASIATAVDYILRKTRIDPNAQCRGLSFQSYAGLLARDWIAIGNAGSGLIIHVDTILGQCGKPHDTETARGEPNANVRSAACKAIGEFCTQCLVSAENRCDVLWNDEAFIHVSRRVLATMLESLGDSNASVRCMVSGRYVSVPALSLSLLTAPCSALVRLCLRSATSPFRSGVHAKMV